MDKQPVFPLSFLGDFRRAKEADKRAQSQPDPASYSAAAAAWRRILCRSDWPALPTECQLDVLDRAAGAYLRWYQSAGNPRSLSTAIRFWQEAIEQSPSSWLRMPAYLSNLGYALRLRYARSGKRADLVEATEACQSAVATAGRRDRSRAAYSNNLALCLRAWYQRHGRHADLTSAIEAWRRAELLSRKNTTFHAATLNNLAMAFRDRYVHWGDPSDLRRAIGYWKRSLSETPQGTAEEAGRTGNLAVAFMDEYKRTGRARYLDDTVRYHERAVAGTAQDSPALPGRVSNLGNALRQRYLRERHISDLDRAISEQESAVELTPKGSQELSTYLSSLALALRTRHAQTGDLMDLERAIEALWRANAQLPSGAPDQASILNNLGLCLREQYVRKGDVRDLQYAVDAWDRAMERSPNPSRASNLGVGLYDFYLLTKDTLDLDRALALWTHALKSEIPGTLAGAVLTNLAMGWRARYQQTANLADLERAIDTYQAAVKKTGASWLDLASRHADLGNAFAQRYRRTMDAGDIRRGITEHRRALALVPGESPLMPFFLNNLANALWLRYEHTNSRKAIEEAIGSWREAWAQLQHAFPSLPVGYQLGQQGIWDVLPRSLLTGLIRRGTGSDTSAPLREALAVAEGSKSRLLAYLVGRQSFPAPVSIPRHLVEDEAKLLDTLTREDSAALANHGRATPDDSVNRSPWSQGRARRAYAANRDVFLSISQRQARVSELERLWREMDQRGPDASAYVSVRRGDVPSFHDLMRLGSELGPETALASLFTLNDVTVLLVLRGGWDSPKVCTCPISRQGWKELIGQLIRDTYAAGRGGHRDSWSGVLETLLQEAMTHLDGVERVIIAPEGQGHLVPWSVVAAKVDWQNRAGSIMPIVTLPTLTMLPRLRSLSRRVHGTALVVGDPRGDLPHARDEADHVGRILGSAPLIGREATKAAVLDELPRARVVHLATHGFFKSTSPLDSGIVLADGILTAREIVALQARVELLILSGCQTGMAGSLRGNEMAGLGHAFLCAGVRTMVASLWRVNDPATAALMTRFHEIREVGGELDRALVKAMETVRRVEKWQHPFYWGAFALTGDWQS